MKTQHKWLTLITLCISLTACFDDVADLHAYKANIANQIQPVHAEVPELKPFQHIAYQPKSLERNPFSLPQRIIEEQMVASTAENNAHLPDGCIQDKPLVTKGPLAAYPLDNLTMKGTLTKTNTIQALVSSTDNKLYLVSSGDAIGLFNGRVVAIESNRLIIEEFAADALGCYQSRPAILALENESSNES